MWSSGQRKVSGHAVLSNFDDIFSRRTCEVNISQLKDKQLLYKAKNYQSIYRNIISLS